MLSLATRGYLFPLLALRLPVGPGPSVVGAKSLVPALSGAADLAPRGPGLSGKGVAAPRIGGALSEAPAAPSAPPSIIGGGALIPDVKKR